MPDRLTDEEYARYAAAHALHPEAGVERLERLDPLRVYGVRDEQSLVNHVLNVMSGEDTRCFRGAFGREMYANDRLNTIVWINEQQPDRSTVYHNDRPDVTTYDRLSKGASIDRALYDVPCEVRTGGSKALEGDRAAANSDRGPAADPPASDPRRAEIEAMFAAMLDQQHGRDDDRS